MSRDISNNPHLERDKLSASLQLNWMSFVVKKNSKRNKWHIIKQSNCLGSLLVFFFYSRWFICLSPQYLACPSTAIGSDRVSSSKTKPVYLGAHSSLNYTLFVEFLEYNYNPFLWNNKYFPILSLMWILSGTWPLIQKIRLILS